MHSIRNRSELKKSQKMHRRPEMESLEHFDVDIDDFGTIFRQGSPVNLIGNVQDMTTLTTNTSDFRSHESTQMPVRNVLTSTRRDVMPIKSWLDELLDFSSKVTRQAQQSLNHIQMDFRRNGMKFDSDFRNHFLYIANNR